MTEALFDFIMASRSGNRFFMKTMGTWACSACGFVPVVSGKTQIVLFDYFACKAEVFISPFGACHLFSLTNALQRDRCVVRARVLGVHVLPERSIAAQVHRGVFVLMRSVRMYFVRVHCYYVAFFCLSTSPFFGKVMLPSDI